MGNVILGSDGIAIRQGIYEAKSTKMTDLGRFIDFEDGRRFRYCLSNGGTSRGLMNAAVPVNTDADAITQTSMTVALSNGYIGEKVVNVLLGAAATAHEFDDGLLVIENGTGLGYAYRIRKNDDQGALYTTPCELTLYDPIKVALAADNVLSLFHNKHFDVVTAPTSEAGPPVGVPLCDVTDNYYFWAQTRGYAPILRHSSGTLTAGKLCGISAAAGKTADQAQNYTYVWGLCIFAASASCYATIDLMLE